MTDPLSLNPVDTRDAAPQASAARLADRRNNGIPRPAHYGTAVHAYSVDEIPVITKSNIAEWRVIFDIRFYCTEQTTQHPFDSFASKVSSEKKVRHDSRFRSPLHESVILTRRLPPSFDPTIDFFCSHVARIRSDDVRCSQSKEYVKFNSFRTAVT